MSRSLSLSDPELVANDDEEGAGAWITLSIEPDDDAYTIEVPGKGTRRRYRP